MSDYQCEHCGTTKQWSCNCWQGEAAQWVPGRAESQARLEQLRDEAYGVGR